MAPTLEKDMKIADAMEKVDCAQCGWQGAIDDLDCGMFGVPVCPSCWSDEIEYTINEGDEV